MEITRRRFLASTAAVTLLREFVWPAAAWCLAAPRRVLRARNSESPSPIAEPYPKLHGGGFSGPPVAASPDPLVSYRWDKTGVSDELQTYQLQPVGTWMDRLGSFRKIHTATGEEVRVLGVGSVRFDFGVESAGWLEFDSKDCSGSVEMSVSEYDEPAVVNTGPPNPKKTLAPKRHGDTYRLELNPELYEGVRFGWIHVRSFEGPWTMSAVRAVCQVKPTNYQGSFECSDPMLNRIWYTGAYSVKANLCKDYFGALLMDRGDRISWTGDAHPAQAAALVAFGNWEFVRENLERSATTNNGIESYSLYWVLSLVEYYQHSGDRVTVERHVNHAVDLLNRGASIYHDPPISFYGWDERLGAGFEAPDCFESKCAYRMLFVHASVEFANVLDALDRNDLSTPCRDRALVKMHELRSVGGWFESFGMHALADAVNTGLMTKEEKGAIFTKQFANRLNRLSFSPFNQYFVLQALASMGRFDEAITTLLDQWGGQIEYGGTAFFETYTPSWNVGVGENGALPNGQSGYVSLAHAWGAGVTAWLTHEVLGIRPASAGFSRIDITPHLGSAITHVSGSVPTPLGDIHYAFDGRTGQCSAMIPDGSKARIGIPTLGGAIHRLLLNGRIIWDGAFHSVDGIGGASLDTDLLYLENVSPARYEFTVSYEKRRDVSRHVDPLVYPITTVQEDDKTKGDWWNAYGKDGHVLFNYDGVRKDRTELPSYVRSVRPSETKIGGCLHEQVVRNVEDRRLPEAIGGVSGPRNLGQLYTGDPIACQQTMTIDVDAVDDQRYNIALYFLDWESHDRRQAIELFDLKSLNRFSPVRILKDFTQGKYLVYECVGAIRFRIDQVRGKNAVLNAMYFDRPNGVPSRTSAR